MSIRWIKTPKPTGLAAVGAHPRSSHLEDTESGETYMFVSPEDRSGDTWRFWLVRSKTGNLRSKAVFASHDEAKAAANAYWKAHREEIIEARKGAPRHHPTDETQQK